VIKLTVSSSDSTAVSIISEENLNHVQFHTVKARSTKHTNMGKCTESWTRDLWTAFPVHRNQYLPTASALV